MKWNLATVSPKKSGLYLVVKTDSTGEYRPVDTLYYSREYDAWNAFDECTPDSVKKNAIPDIRNHDGLREYQGYVYAWAEYEINPEELDALKKGVA